ncbi:MAG: type I-E CRISPR-associated protein Cas6/Cse3/CasE [Betaproteobacteria bacterium]|nr:type I-E CRISPR-associated protein Cas6/Cse3/CasE [Betaproteobacteria bacterium]
MYFTLIEPVPGYERAAARERAVGPYEDHRWLWKFFPAEEGTPRDFLYRRLDSESRPRYYVVSRRPAVRTSHAWHVETRDYVPKLGTGEQLHFDLRANPVVTRNEDEKSKRHDVVMQAKKHLLEARGLARWQDWQDEDKPALYDLVHKACSDWLVARAERLGFRVTKEILAVDAYTQHCGKKNTVQFSTVDFSGELAVTDPGVFTRTLFGGIGHSKAFGCGLLLVKRI